MPRRRRGSAWLVGVALALASLLPALAPEAAAAVVIVSPPVVSNVTDTSFTVSWVTNVPAGGYVRYGTAAGQLTAQQLDERGADYTGYTHHVKVTGLLAGTKYYYGVTSGDATADSTGYYLTTGPSGGTPQAPTPNTFSGQVRKPDGSPAVGAIVYVYLQHQPGASTQANSSKLSTLTNSTGTFEIDVSQARGSGTNQTFLGYFQYALSGDRVFYQVEGGMGYGGAVNRVAWQSVDTNTTSAGSSPTSVDISLPYADPPTPTSTFTATPTATVTPAGPTPTPPATATTAARPSPTPVATAEPTSPPLPAVSPSPVRSPTPQPAPPATAAPSPSPRPTGTPTVVLLRPPPPVELARPTGSPAAGYARKAVPTSPGPTSTPVAVPTPARPASASVAPEHVPPGILALITLAGVLVASGLGLVTVGVVSGLRRRSA